MANKYLATIGIECHVQLKTKTKLFSGANNDAREAPPNTLINHIDVGMPGALPVLNRAAVKLASRAAFALKSKPAKFSKFVRKHYFYPDLPMGYQITQYDQPIVLGGHVDITVDGESRRIGITRAQLEADAGKSTHPSGADYTLVDLNRAGTPLLEIVSEPDIHSAEEAKAYAREIYLLMRYAGVSDANLYYGNMRFDVNVSLSSDPKKLGTRTETKNLNSFKAVYGAVDHEIKRQTELLEKGEEIVQQTMGWDEAKQKTVPQRTKEDAHDYRYFPDPDLPPVVLDDKYIDEIAESMPVMHDVLRDKLVKLGLDESVVETLVEEIPAGRFMLDVLKEAKPEQAKRIANWLASDVQALVAEEKVNWDEAVLERAAWLQLCAMTESNQVSSTGAKSILAVLVEHGGDPLTIAKERDLLQVSDEAEIEVIVKGVIESNPKAAEDIKNGEVKAIGFLVGQIMKQSKGKANPELAQKLIKKLL